MTQERVSDSGSEDPGRIEVRPSPPCDREHREDQQGHPCGEALIDPTQTSAMVESYGWGESDEDMA